MLQTGRPTRPHEIGRILLLPRTLDLEYLMFPTSKSPQVRLLIFSFVPFSHHRRLPLLWLLSPSLLNSSVSISLK
jgi:hypothetical protein